MATELDHSALGELASIGQLLREIRDEIRKGEEYGQLGDIDVVAWSAGGRNGYDYDGVFAAFAVFNLSAAVINVSLTPNGADPARPNPITLSARGFLILPYRGTHVDVGGAAAGTALVCCFSSPQPANAGTF